MAGAEARGFGGRFGHGARGWIIVFGLGGVGLWEGALVYMVFTVSCGFGLLRLRLRV